MKRRTLLKGMAASLALQTVSLAAPAILKRAPRVLKRVRPGEPGWPGAARWQALKTAVDGQLLEVHPLFDACTRDAKAAPCLDVMKNMRNPFFIGDQPAGTQVSGWLNAWTPAPSAYAVKAQNTSHVVAAVNFARDNNLRLVVKGGGHSYLGTSNAPDSLLVWTRAMNAVTQHDAFVPQNGEGRVAPVPAVSAQAGAMWIDLYQAVTNGTGRYVQGGGCTSVGVAGLVQSGGFGSFSKGFGTAASGLLEAEIVTADGTVRVVNAFSDPDLFWALKGGGGGSWGVVTRLTLRTRDLPAHFGGAFGRVTARTDDAYRKLIARFVAFYADNLLNPHWGEQVSFGPDNTLKLSMVCQDLDAGAATRVWQPFFDWLKASSDDLEFPKMPRTGVVDARHWWDVEGNDSMIADARPGAPKTHGWWEGDSEQVGAWLHGYESLWLPASLLAPAQQSRFADALFAASRHKSVGLHLNKGLAGAPADALAAARDTATNPAVTEAFALAIIADGEAPAYPGFPRAAVDMGAAAKDARAIDLAAAELRKLVPQPGSYVSESNYFNESWREAYWGANYSRLRQIKNRYDPDGLFFVHHGVGSEDWSADGFTRVA